MERRKSELLEDVVKRFLRQEGLETPINQHRLINAWAEIVAPEIAKATNQLYIKNQTLVVYLSSPIIKNELQLQRSQLVTQLNNRVGANVIVDIHFI